MPVETEILEEKKEEKEKKIYITTYKKGFVVGTLHFAHFGDLEGAIHKVKEWLQKRHLKHLHTVPFLISLDDSNADNGYDVIGEGYSVNP